MNQKTLNIIYGIVIVVLIGAVVYFAVGKKSEPVAQQPSPAPAQVTNTPKSNPTPTSTPAQTNNSTPTPTSNIFNSKTAKCSDIANIRPSFSFKIPTGALVTESDKCGAVDVSFGQPGQPNSALIVIDSQYAKELSLSPEYPGLSSGQTLSDPKNACQKPTIGGYSDAAVTFTNEKTFQIGSYPGYTADYTVIYNNPSPDSGPNSRIACVGNIHMQGYPDTNSTMQAGFSAIINSLSFGN